MAGLDRRDQLSVPVQPMSSGCQTLWRCRESNPGPLSPCQGFSVRSSLCLYSTPPITRTSRCDGPSRCEFPYQRPRPALAVSPLADAGEPGRRHSRADRLRARSGGEGEVALTISLGAYWFAMTLEVVSRLHLHASPDSTSRVETVHPLVRWSIRTSIPAGHPINRPRSTRRPPRPGAGRRAAPGRCVRRARTARAAPSRPGTARSRR